MFIYNIIAKHFVDYQRACHFFIFYNFGTENAGVFGTVWEL